MTAALNASFVAIMAVFLAYDLLGDCLAVLALHRGMLVIRIRSAVLTVPAPSGEPKRWVLSGLTSVVWGVILLSMGYYLFGVPFTLSGPIDFWIAWTLWRRRRRGKPSWATGVVRRIGNRLTIVPVPQGAWQ